MNRPLVWIVLFLVASPLYAQKVGDELIVIAPSEAKLTVDGRTVAVVPRGGTVTVEELGKARFRVNRRGVSGWIDKQDVLTAADAIGFFSRAIEKKPSAADYRGRGNAWSCKGDNDKAIADYTAAIRLNPKDAVAFYDRGLSYESKGDHDKAIADLTEAIRLSPNDADNYCDRARSYVEKGNYDSAIADASKAIHLDPKCAKAFYDRGVAYEAKGDHDKAIADHTEAVRLGPNLAWTYYGRAGAYEGKGNYDSAIADLNKAIQLDPRNGDSYVRRAFAYNRKGQNDKAIADYSEAIRINPKDAEIRLDRGIALGERGEYDKAIADFSEAMRLDPKNAHAYFFRGIAHSNKGEADKAVADYTQAIRIDPKYSNAYCGRGAAFDAMGNYDKAIADYTQAIRLDPKSASLYWNRAIAYENKRDYKEMMADLSEIVRLDPKNVDAYLRRAWHYNQRGDPAKAVADLDAAIKLKPNAPHYYELRAALWIGQGEYDGGIKDLQTALRLNPKDPAAKFEDWPKAPLSAEALEHGQRQVAQMLKDRPAMGQFRKKAEWLYQWAARKFAGEDLHEDIFWNDSESLGPFDADNQSPTPEKPGYIRLRPTYCEGPDQGKKRLFEELWANAVFELYNITGTKDFRHADEEAAHGSISKEQYVTKKIAIESRAAEKTRAFFIHVFLPWAKGQRIDAHPGFWFVGCRWEPGQDLVLPFVAKSDAYWQNYERDYENIVLGSLIERGEGRKAENLTTELLGRAGTPAEKAAIYTARGSAYYRAGERNKAIAEYTKAIASDPKAADGYRCRGDTRLGHGDNASQGDIDEAIADYTKAIQLSPRDGQPHAGRGWAYLRKGDFGNAIADYSEAISSNPRDARLFDGRGCAYSEKGDFNQAIADYSAGIRLDPKNAHLYRDRAYAYMAQGNLDKAIADVSEANRIDPQGAERYYAQGVSSARNGEFDQAIIDYTVGIQLSPKDVRFRIGRGFAYHKKGDLGRAIADYSEAIRLDPENYIAYCNRGDAFEKQGQPDKAIADATEAIRLLLKRTRAYSGRVVPPPGLLVPRRDDNVPDNSSAPIRLVAPPGLLVPSHDDNVRDDSVPDNSSAPTELVLPPIPLVPPRDNNVPDDNAPYDSSTPTELPDSHLAQAYCNRGAAFLKKGDPDKAMADENEAIRLDPNLGEARCYRGVAYAAKGDRGKAIASYSEAVRLDPKGADYYYRRAAVYADDGQFDRAIANYSEGAELSPKDTRFYIGRGTAYRKNRDYDKAIADYSEAIRLDPKGPVAYCSRGDVYEKEGRWDKAIADEDRALRLDPNLGEAYYYRGIAYAKKGDKAKAEADTSRAKKLGYKAEKEPKRTSPATTDASRRAEPYRIRPLDVLAIHAGGTLPFCPVDGQFLVEPSGQLSLGPAYGRIQVQGLTLAEAQAAAKKQLAEVLASPSVRVSAAGHATHWPAEVPKAPYRISANDLLKIEVAGTLPNRPIWSTYLVEPNGDIPLGPPYGDVQVKGLTPEDAERAISKKLEEVLSSPDVSVTLAGWKSERPSSQDTKRAEITNSIGMKLVPIPAGEFMMGGTETAEELVKAFAAYHRKPEFFKDEYPRHRMHITRPFYLGKYEVTVGQFRRFVEDSGHKTEAERDGTGGWGYNAATGKCEGRNLKYNWRDPGFKQTDDYPVLDVTWNDAVAFCRWLSRKEGKTYRLPTEAEWEYAARAGTETRYSNGDDPAALAKVGNVKDAKGRTTFPHVQELDMPPSSHPRFTVPVGQFPPNRFGLCDMHGNVWEWCSDRYGEDYYARSPVDDPQGPDAGKKRVRRGGGWNSFPLWARASFRNWNTPASRCVNLGFRVVLAGDRRDGAANQRVGAAVELPPQRFSVSSAKGASPAPAAGATASFVVQQSRLQRAGETPAPQDGAVKIIFGGDVMLDGGPGHAIVHGQDPFAEFASLLHGADVAVCNLECVLAGGGRQVLKAYTFHGPQQAVPLLKQYFTAVSVANNHTGDYGPEAFVAQLSLLENAHVPCFGGGRDSQEARRPLILERKGLRIALLGRNGFPPRSFAAGEKRPGVAWLNDDELIEDIRAARRRDHADVVIPFLHWGIEATPGPTDRQRQLARRLIDAGASAVVGAHPHVTQTVEIYKGRPIVYSLGNFVFDYYPNDPAVWTGWLAQFTVRRSGEIDLETFVFQIDPAGIPHLLPAPKQVAPAGATRTDNSVRIKTGG